MGSVSLVWLGVGDHTHIEQTEKTGCLRRSPCTCTPSVSAGARPSPQLPGLLERAQALLMADMLTLPGPAHAAESSL